MSELIVDASFSSKAEKRAFLAAHSDKRVLMDLTLYDPAPFYADFPQLVGVFSGLLAIDGRCELHLQADVPEALEALKKHGLTATVTSIISCGFVVPRTLAMIINEAYFAQDIASRDDINRAMKFGVNYPMGPFEWAQGKEKLYGALLKELLETTGDERYRPHPALS